jgi:hypothetical protein
VYRRREYTRTASRVRRGQPAAWRDEALNQHTMNRKFHVIPLGLDDVTPPDFISNFSNIEIGETELGSAAAAQILRGLDSPRI